MTPPEFKPEELAEAIETLAARLGEAGRLAAVARFETRLHGQAPLDRLLAAERAMAAAWPDALLRRPTHELVWRLPADDGQAAFEVCAYDLEGRLMARTASPRAAEKRRSAAHA